MATSTIPAVVATPREGKFNKNAARRVRVSGKIPAVVYGAGQEAVAVAVDPRVITKILHSDSGHNTIFDLDVTGAALVKAMIVDWQHEPIKGALLHIDLKRIAMDKKMTVSVAIQLVGVPVSWIGTETRIALSIAMRFRSMCSRAPLIGSCCQSTIIAFTSAAPVTSRSKIVLWPESEWRILVMTRGSTVTATASEPAP